MSPKRRSLASDRRRASDASWQRRSRRTAVVVGRTANGRWCLASVVIAISTWTGCGQRVVRHTAHGDVYKALLGLYRSSWTALGSVTVWQKRSRTTQRTSTRSSPVVSLTSALTASLQTIPLSTHCTNSELGVSPRLTALSIFTQQSLT